MSTSDAEPVLDALQAQLGIDAAIFNGGCEAEKGFLGHWGTRVGRVACLGTVHALSAVAM